LTPAAEPHDGHELNGAERGRADAGCDRIDLGRPAGGENDGNGRGGRENDRRNRKP
jgi:hypothetical protein